MIQLKFTVDLSYDVVNHPSDFIFNIHAAHTAHQTVVAEWLDISPPMQPLIFTDPECGTRFMRLRAEPGTLTIRYSATVNLSHHLETPARIAEIPIAQLPPSVLPYIYPSRYCQSDQLYRFASTTFGQMPHGYARVLAIADWVRQRTTFQPGSSNANTSAIDTWIEQVGVCRDFAHLMIAVCRAINIPARFVTGVDYGANPLMGPSDFHAYVEVYLGGRWYLFEPSGVSPIMGLLRIGTGRDAADASFATIFGTIRARSKVITIVATHDPANGFELPQHGSLAVSSMDGPGHR